MRRTSIYLKKHLHHRLIIVDSKLSKVCKYANNLEMIPSQLKQFGISKTRSDAYIDYIDWCALNKPLTINGYPAVIRVCRVLTDDHKLKNIHYFRVDSSNRENIFSYDHIIPEDKYVLDND